MRRIGSAARQIGSKPVMTDQSAAGARSGVRSYCGSRSGLHREICQLRTAGKSHLPSTLHELRNEIRISDRDAGDTPRVARRSL